MSSSAGPSNVQARVVLQTLCNFILPLVQPKGGQTTKNVKTIPLGTEADDFVRALENFISNIISRPQASSLDIGIEATLDIDPFDYLEAMNWLWDIPAPDDQLKFAGSSNDKEDSETMPTESPIIIKHPPQNIYPRQLSLNDIPRIEDGDRKQELGDELQKLRRIIQTLPIRLLCFEPRNQNLHISLLERNDIYNYLAQKVKAEFREWGYVHLSSFTRYAILSHTWTQKPGELSYSDWHRGSLDATRPKCRKVVNFCRAAWENHGLTFGWVDTICINKESSAELDESIRSMYAWYSRAEVCITYLAGTQHLSYMQNDPWFSRGWTFQELVASDHIKFYNVNWKQLSTGGASKNDKYDSLIALAIELATTITPDELLNIQDTSISRRMQLVAKRQVTREEDIAYCLMGIFNVSISTAYGEGRERAFFRLLKEIFDSTKDVSDIFNWGGDHPSASRRPITSLFPSSPSDYLTRSSNTQLHQWHPIKPLTLTHLGLRTPVLLMPAISIRSSVKLRPQPIGDFYATAEVQPCHLRQSTAFNWSEFERLVLPKDYHILDKRVTKIEDTTAVYARNVMRWAFGTLNVEAYDDGTSIRLSKACFAVLLKKLPASGGYGKIYTKEPIVFNLQKNGNGFDTKGTVPFDLENDGNDSDEDEPETYYQIERSQLGSHGMQLLTLYL